VAERKRILIADDDANVRERLEAALSGEYDVSVADSVDAAIDAVRRTRPHLLALDGTIGGGTGAEGGALRLLRLARRARLRLKIIVITPRDDEDLAVSAFELGACDCYRRPVDPDDFAVLARRALRAQELEDAADALPTRLAGVERFESLVGTCPAMRDAFSAARKVASTDVCVMLVGERGTGKELIGRGIHHLGHRCDAPFVTVDPGATPDEFIEAEIFGGGNGTFGGAETVPGRLEQAHRGTLFLHSAERLSPHVQARLHAFVSSRGIERAGRRISVEADVRLIAAAEDDLEARVRAGTFSEDLYYDLGVVTIALPPLRERGEDIAILARDLLERYAEEHGRGIAGYTRSAVRAMMIHDWPGNIPEMENRVRRAVVMSGGRTISASDLGLDGEPELAGRTLGEAKDALEHEIVVDALVRAAGNVSRAARAIGVSRSTVYDLVRKYELDVSSFKALARRGRGARAQNDDPSSPRAGRRRGHGSRPSDIDSAEGGP